MWGYLQILLGHRLVPAMWNPVWRQGGSHVWFWGLKMCTSFSSHACSRALNDHGAGRVHTDMGSIEGQVEGRVGWRWASGDDPRWPEEELWLRGIVEPNGAPVWDKITTNPPTERMATPYSHIRDCSFCGLDIKKTMSVFFFIYSLVRAEDTRVT